MSQYSVNVGRTRYVYGYDRVTEEYFLTAVYARGVRAIVGGPSGNGWSGHDLIAAAKTFKVPIPEDQLAKAALDLPF